MDYHKFRNGIENILNGINRSQNPHMKKIQLVEDLYVYFKSLIKSNNDELEACRQKIKTLESKIKGLKMKQTQTRLL